MKKENRMLLTVDHPVSKDEFTEAMKMVEEHCFTKGIDCPPFRISRQTDLMLRSCGFENLKESLYRVSIHHIGFPDASLVYDEHMESLRFRSCVSDSQANGEESENQVVDAFNSVVSSLVDFAIGKGFEVSQPCLCNMAENLLGNNTKDEIIESLKLLFLETGDFPSVQTIHERISVRKGEDLKNLMKS